jgi:SAM-dependent methyltransferase
MRVLEIGPDQRPSTYQRVVADPTITWETLDMDEGARWTLVSTAALTHRSTNEYIFPIADNAFDVVVSGQVIEHVRKIWRWVPELARVCKPGGLVITINPVSWEYHEAPVDCWRIYPEGMRALHADAGLTTELAVFESLEDRFGFTPYYLMKQAAKMALGRRPFFLSSFLPVVDTISVGRKG